MHIGQLLNGLGGPCGGMPPVLSVTWYPVKERVTATGLAAIAAYAGIGMAYIIGNLLTIQPLHNTTGTLQCPRLTRLY